MRRRAALAVAGAAGVVVLGGAGAALAAAGGAPRGVSVAGVELSGLGRAAAAERVAAALAARASAPVAVTADDVTTQLDPVAAGLAVDVEATVDEALDVGPLDRLRGLLGDEREVAPTRRVDRAALDRALAAVAKQVDRAPREGAVRFRESRPFPVVPLVGRVLDRDGAVEAVAESWLRTDGPVRLPVELTPVRSTAEGVQAALTAFGEPAVAAPVELDVEGKRLVVRPADIAASFRIEADETGTVVPTLEGDKLRAELADRLAAVEVEPVDATFDVSSGAPVLVPGRDGRRIDPDALANAVAPLLRAPAPRRAALALEVTPPRVTTARARTLGVKEVIGTFETYHPCCAPRVTNIHKIADIVDGYVVLPGETYSLNGHVGPRDSARGFVEAPQILRGEFVNAIGGGISQFATTMFNAVFFAGLQDVEHKPHSYFISRYPPGREATVSIPKPDLKWRNDSPHGVLVTTSHTPRSIRVTLWGTKRFDEIRSVTGPRTRVRSFPTRYISRPDCVSADGANGFDIVVTRVFLKGGKEVKREQFKTRYLPEPRFICGRAPRRASSAPSGGSSPPASAAASPRPSPRPSASR